MTSIILGLFVIIPAAMPAATGGTKGKASLAPWAKIATSSSSRIFYNATDWAGAGITIAIGNTSVDRLNRNVNFTVIATKMLEANGGPTGWNPSNLEYCFLNITYPNAMKSLYISMNQLVSKIPIFYYNFVTNLSLPVGTYAIHAYPSNGSAPYKKFTLTPVSNMTIYNINPTGIVTLNTTTVYRNSTLGFNITVHDPETPYLNLVWNVTMVQGSTGKPWGYWQMGSAFNQSCFFNTSSSVLGTYYFVIKVYDGEGGHYVNMFASSFTVVNNLPIIHAVIFAPKIYSDIGGPGIYRSQNLTFMVNLTDVDNPWYYTSVYAIFQRKDVDENFTSGNFTANRITGNFTGFITANIQDPIAYYSIIIKAIDLSGGIAYYKPTANQTIGIRDNHPTVSWVHINNQNLTNGLHLSSYEMMSIQINVSAPDQNLDFISLEFQNTADKSQIFTFNITLQKGMANFIVDFNISSSVLPTGLWTIYVYAYDFDGGFFKGPQGSIVIDPDTRDITAIVIGAALLLIAGFVIGGMAIWRYANSKIKDIRRDMIIKGRGKAEQSGNKKPGEKKAPPKAGKKSKYQ